MQRNSPILPRLLLIATILSLLLTSQPLLSGTRSGVSAQSGQVPSGNVIVVLKAPGVDPAAVAASVGANATFVYSTALVGFAANLTPAAAERLARSPLVESIFADVPVFPTDQEIPAGVARINTDQNPIASIDGVDNPIGASIAIIDTGVDSVSDLNVVGGVNVTATGPQSGPDCSYSGSSGDYSDSFGHGTHVAGTAAARDNNSGVVGVAPGASIYSVRVLTSASGGGTLSQLVCGIDWTTANANLIDVANMSLQTTGTAIPCGQPGADPLHISICSLVAAGVPVIVAAGNGSGDIANTVPAMYPEVITVTAFSDFDGSPGGLAAPSCTGSTGSDDQFAPYSKYGAAADIMAPGTCIKSIRIAESGGGSFVPIRDKYGHRSCVWCSGSLQVSQSRSITR